jgi:flavin-dependent dehydrogenase
VCGDFVGPVSLVELQRLGVNEFPEYKQTNVIRQASLYLNGKHMITSRIPSVPDLPSYGRVIPRKQLDYWVFRAAQAAGAQIKEGFRAQSFSVDPQGVGVTFESGSTQQRFYTRAVIGADGSNSMISRLLHGEGARPKDRIVAIRAYYDQVAGPSDHADLYFTSESFPGYYWLFPTGDASANVGLGMLLETLPPTQEHPRRLLERLISEDPALRERLGKARLVGKVVGWPLNTYNRHMRIIGERVLLAGDAAGLINPLNGEGIQYAMLSARWAAEALANCAESDDFSALALQEYEQRVREELRYDMALAGMIVELIRNRNLNPVWLRALQIIVTRARVDPTYADITGSVLAGLTPSTSVFTYKIITSTLKQAAMSLGIDVAKGLFRGPRYWMKQGVQTGKAGINLLTGVTQNPVEYVRWGVGVADNGVELATQVVSHMIDSTRHGKTGSG